jgi:hypothetical protein
MYNAYISFTFCMIYSDMYSNISTFNTAHIDKTATYGSAVYT